MKKIIILFAVSLMVISCNKAPQTEVLLACDTTQNQLIMPVAWYQTSGEMEALYLQGFNVAQMRLEEFVKKEKGTLAVVVDIDETMLNNSPIEAEAIIKNKSFSKEFWAEWSAKSGAEATPGSIEFANYAKTKGVEIFYISNRDSSEIGSTIANLVKVGFPYADSAHCLFKTTTSNKEPRRREVGKTHKIVMLIGDNLGDFADIFDHRQDNYGKNAVDSLRNMFGKKFIVLPNPMYGDWEKAIYRGQKLSACQKDSARRSILKGF